MARPPALLCCASLCAGHASMSSPPNYLDPDSKYGLSGGARNAGCTGQRAPGEQEAAKGCTSEWYTNYTFIPGAATMPATSAMITQQQGRLGDWTKRMPWRAPGTAPVFSPCGYDGGNPNGCPAGNPGGGGCLVGGYGHGPDQRSLPGNKRPQQWTAGEVREVAWTITANHGGGYQYRLCKLPATGRAGLTEKCFQGTPLAFVGDTTWIQYDTGSRTSFKNRKTSKGTTPAGSTWMQNPVPGCYVAAAPTTNGNDGRCDGPQFTPPVPGLYGFSCTGVYGQKKFACHHVIDKIQVPADLAPGDYVVSFRYDCEQTSQVWNSCGDVHVSGGLPPAPPAPAPPPAPPTPATLYSCTGGECTPDAGGVDRRICAQACKSPAPGPAPPAPAPPAKRYECRAAGTYRMETSYSQDCPAGDLITTRAACSAAAVKLGLAASAGLVSPQDMRNTPAGCYYQATNPYAGVWFNSYMTPHSRITTNDRSLCLSSAKKCAAVTAGGSSKAACEAVC